MHPKKKVKTEETLMWKSRLNGYKILVSSTNQNDASINGHFREMCVQTSSY